MELSEAKIYIESLSAYNEGKGVGEWLDLSDYSSGEEVMEAIGDFLKKISKKTKRVHEEYAIHDYENFPKRFYSESMSEKDFDEIYEFFEVVEDTDIPADVLDEYVTNGNELSNASDNFQGKYDDKKDFAYQTVEELGLQSFSSPESYITMSDTDKRITAGEEADSIVDSMSDDELIEEAGMDSDKSDLEEKISTLETEVEDLESSIEELESDLESEQEKEGEERDDDEIDRLEGEIESAKSDIKDKEKEKSEAESELEGLADTAKEKVQSDKADEIEGKLDDPYDYFVNEQGMYSAEDFFKANFVMIDYDKVADDLEQDYEIIDGEDGNIYVFRNYAKGGEVKPKNNMDFKNYYAQHGALITGGSYFGSGSEMAKGGKVKSRPYAKGEKVNGVLIIDADKEFDDNPLFYVWGEYPTYKAMDKGYLRFAYEFYLDKDGNKYFLWSGEKPSDEEIKTLLSKKVDWNYARNADDFVEGADKSSYARWLDLISAKGGKIKSVVRKKSRKGKTAFVAKSKPQPKKKPVVDKSNMEWDEIAITELRELDKDDTLIAQRSLTGFNGFEAEGEHESNRSFLVFENEDEAEKYAIDKVRNDLSDNPEYFTQSWLIGILNAEKAESWFREAYNEWNRGYANDIKDESYKGEYTNRLAEEMYERGIISEEEAKDPDFDLDDKIDDFVEDMTQGMIDEGDYGYEHYKSNFGEEQAGKVIMDNNLIDIDEASEEAVRSDGVAHFIAGYDGKTINLTSGAVAYKN